MSRRFATILLALALTLAMPAPAQSAVTVHEAWDFSANGTMPIKGHGFGHGHGMSQYGAEGAARQGLTERQIVAFYYPGTKLARFTARIAVLITADTTNDLQVRWQRGLTVTDRGTGVRYALPTLANVARWRLHVSRGRTIVQLWRNGAWRGYLVGGKRYFAGDGEFGSPNGRLSLILPRGVVRQYRGVLRHSRPSAKSAQRDTVNVLGIDNYVKGVVPAEMPASWHPEAVQSQAIAARTYGLNQRASNLKRHYQICDTTQCQVYKGISGEHPDGNKAVAATAQLYLTYDGRPAFTQFSASSGGWTSAGSAPYLVRKRDPYDDWSGNYVHNWSTRINKSALERRYPGLGKVKGLTVTRREEGGGDWRGRVLSLTVRGSQGTKTLSGNDFRFIYGLRSTWFTRG